MLDPVFLVPVFFLTGVVGIGHFAYRRWFVSPENECKRFECKAVGVLFTSISVVALILLIAT